MSGKELDRVIAIQGSGATLPNICKVFGDDDTTQM